MLLILITSAFAAYMQPVPPMGSAPLLPQHQQQIGAVPPQALPAQQIQMQQIAPFPNLQPFQVQQSGYPNMQVPAAATPMNCEQILDPAFCKGPAMQSGYICSWQENECESVDLHEAHEAPEQPVRPMGSAPLPPQHQQQQIGAVPPLDLPAYMQPFQVQQSGYPNMQVPAATTPVNCEQILAPAFCKGPAMQSGYICSWQENECESVDPHEAHEASEAGEMPEQKHDFFTKCEAFSLNQFACQSRPGCVFQDFECKMAESAVIPHPFNANGGHGVFPHPGAMPMGPAQPAQPMTPAYPVQPMAPAYPVQPMAPAYPVQPLAPAYPVPPMNPAAPMPVPAGALPAPTQPANPEDRPGTAFTPQQPIGIAPQPIYTPNVASQHPAQTLPPAHPTRPAGPQFCASLPEPQCFGPSMRQGELCMWDADDFECITASESDMEAICNQFYTDPVKCDQHENCFWDEVDKECAENQYTGMISDKYTGMLSDKPILTQICSNFHDVMSCASQAMCFWDVIANGNLGLCVNVVQAENVCRVLDTAIHCSTSVLCHWRDGYCQTAGLQGLLQAAPRLQKSAAAKGPENKAAPTTNWQLEGLLVGVGASVLGLTIGLFVSWAHAKYQTDQVSNEDYRDIMMDMNTQVRQIV